MCVFDSSPLSTFRVIHEKLDSRTQGSWWLGYENAQLNSIADRAAATCALPLSSVSLSSLSLARAHCSTPPLLTSVCGIVGCRTCWTADLSARRQLYSEAVDVLEFDPPWLTLYHHTTFVGMAVEAGGREGMVQDGLVGRDGILDVRKLPQAQ